MTDETKSPPSNWQARTEVILEHTSEEQLVLEIITAKTSEGITTEFSVVVRRPRGPFLMERSLVSGAFSKDGSEILVGNNVTEKATWQVHQKALSQMDEVVAKVRTMLASPEAASIH